jgi:hypothetical protein
VAQYNGIEDVDPQQLVSRLKKRWLRDKKLDVDPSHVTLWLVKRGAGLPDATEEAAAALLDDPSATLHAAGLAPTTWLLAVFAGEGARRAHARPRALPVPTHDCA